MKVLITGGAGFVGSWLVREFLETKTASSVTIFDNLHRRGSETNLKKFKAQNIPFIHGDIRVRSDLFDINEKFDLIVEASAEPSVLAGVKSSPEFVIQTNLNGAINCLEYAREQKAAFLFLSTSRVYSIADLTNLPLEETDRRYSIKGPVEIPGMSELGVTEKFSTQSARSFYGGSKLAAEIMVQEYCSAYGLKGIINRCGVICGSGQFGKVDQGAFTLWVANHFFGRSLRYTGFGGAGKQVRDLLHPKDLFQLIRAQTSQSSKWAGQVYNIGGGLSRSSSLREFTDLCKEVTGKEVKVAQQVESSTVDVPYYVTDHTLATRDFGWQPRTSVRDMVVDIHGWLRDNESELKHIFS